MLSKMTEHSKGVWNAKLYRRSAAFVPKMAGKVIEWLDLQKDDVVLDIGCGDGTLDLEFAKLLSQGKGTVLGIDSSPSMIEASRELCKDYPNATFQVLDATKICSNPQLTTATFTKAFSNHAFHWILRPEATRAALFRGVHAALAPGAVFAFQMFGQSSINELATALLMACGRRCPGGIAGMVDAGVLPWFLPDEAWITAAVEEVGFRVDRVVRQWTPVEFRNRDDDDDDDAAGSEISSIDDFVRFLGPAFLEAVPEAAEREAAVQEAVQALEVVCDDGRGGHMISHVRLQVLATKL